MCSCISRKVRRITIPRPRLNEAGLTTHIFAEQCFAGTFSATKLPFEISLNFDENIWNSLRQFVLFGYMYSITNVVGVVSKTE